MLAETEKTPLLTPPGLGVQVVLSYQDLVYRIQTKKGLCRPAETKTILESTSGAMNGQMNAILGPTGSGKTTLLDILAGRIDKRTLTGTVLMNGRTVSEKVRCVSGYVAQNDVLLGQLTVRENLHFSALLRLPQSTSEREKIARVTALIKDLNLTHIADNRVGTELRRGISGGEKKRTSIGVELITSPSLLFLDEPTTGLDAYTAVSVMQLLHNLSKMGTVVVFSIHQPRYALFKLFDTLTLLAKGHTVFHGPATEALDFFKQQGHHCDERENPADFFLDVVQRDENDSLALATAYRFSHTFQTTQKTLTSASNYQSDDANVKEKSPGYPTGAFYQFGVLSKRTILNLLRNKPVSVIHWIVSVIIGLITGGIYFQLTKTDPKTGIQNRVGAFFLIVLNSIFVNLSAVDLFIQERAIFKHESLGGYYRTSSYFFAHVLFDIIPYRVIPTTIMCSITYWMIGFTPDVDKFFFYLLNLILTTVAACSMAFLFSALISNRAIATLLLTLTFVLSMIFGGLLVNLRKLSKIFYWLKYLSIFHYSMEALCINELQGMEFCPKHANETCPSGHNSTGTQYLIEQGFVDSKWITQVALGSILGGVLLSAYLRLRFMGKTR